MGYGCYHYLAIDRILAIAYQRMEGSSCYNATILFPGGHKEVMRELPAAEMHALLMRAANWNFAFTSGVVVNVAAVWWISKTPPDGSNLPQVNVAGEIFTLRDAGVADTLIAALNYGEKGDVAAVLSSVKAGLEHAR